jgi:hypothetical protein
MKHLLLFSALLFGGACSGPSKPATTQANDGVTGDVITLGHSDPAVGDTWTEEKTDSMSMSLTAQGQSFQMVAGSHEVKTIEVLEVTHGTVTKARITFQTVDHSQKLSGQEQAGPSLIAGKSYILTAGDPITVSTDAGPAPADETAQVLEIEDRFGKGERLDRVLDGKTFRRDEEVTLSPEEIARSMDDGGLKVDSLALTYRGMEDDLALFDMKTTMEQPTPSGPISMDLTGKVKVDPKKNEPVSMTLDGNLHMAGQVTGDGTMRSVTTHTR